MESPARKGFRPQQSRPWQTRDRGRTSSLILKRAGQALMELSPETFKPPEHNSVPNPPERVKVKVQVMQRVKGGRVHFASHVQMPQVGARTGAARMTPAARIRWTIVLRVPRILDVEAPF